MNEKGNKRWVKVDELAILSCFTLFFLLFFLFVLSCSFFAFGGDEKMKRRRWKIDRIHCLSSLHRFAIPWNDSTGGDLFTRFVWDFSGGAWQREAVYVVLNCCIYWYGYGVCISGEECGGGEEWGKEGDGFVGFGGGESGIRKGVGAVLWRLLFNAFIAKKKLNVYLLLR